MAPRTRKDEAEPHLPLTPAMFQVLLALADEERHGYAILKEIARRTEGKVRLSAGTLYGIIKRLLETGMIVESDERPDPGLDDERRRYYKMTGFGLKVARLEETLASARSKKLMRRTDPV